ncbi:MAG: tRNA pseudouridine(55) synthase TruB [Treponemataceae bacterium]
MDNKIIIPFAKKAGLTSFSSLWQFKKILQTKKIGHTGVLDNFADGLMIALLGNGTKLSTYFTNCDKRYLAFFVFGVETETLDYSGDIVAKKKLPELSKLLEIIKRFKGTQMQVPPLYSGVQVEGQRAYKAARAGNEIKLPKREITIYSLDLLCYELEPNTQVVKNACFDIRCSKGTYIRALCRDIAQACNSCAYVGALRRTELGFFKLEESLGAERLPEFKSQCLTLDESLKLDAENKENYSFDDDFTLSQIKEKALAFTPEMAESLNLDFAILKKEFLPNFKLGQRLRKGWFVKLKKTENPLAVFCEKNFCGMIKHSKKGFFYKFVIK